MKINLVKLAFPEYSEKSLNSSSASPSTELLMGLFLSHLVKSILYLHLKKPKFLGYIGFLHAGHSIFPFPIFCNIS